MSLRHDCCTPTELPTLLAALDAEFITGRGRTVSLAVRYPHLFTLAALPHVHVLRARERIIACAITRPFTWALPMRRWAGAMIGMVYTVPDQRGAGHARALLGRILATLRHAGSDIAVLWSGLEGYYERLGWRRADCGVYGIAPTAGGMHGAPDVGDSLDPTRLHALRRAASPLIRAADAWQTLPLPVTRCRLVTTADAYALIGSQGSRSVLYEMNGDARAFPALWRRTQHGAVDVHVNVAQFGPAYRWLSRHTRIRWQPQRLTFWQPLSGAGMRLELGRWYVPYFDRI